MGLTITQIQSLPNPLLYGQDSAETVLRPAAYAPLQHSWQYNSEFGRDCIVHSDSVVECAEYRPGSLRALTGLSRSQRRTRSTQH